MSITKFISQASCILLGSAMYILFEFLIFAFQVANSRFLSILLWYFWMCRLYIPTCWEWFLGGNFYSVAKHKDTERRSWVNETFRKAQYISIFHVINSAVLHSKYRSLLIFLFVILFSVPFYNYKISVWIRAITLNKYNISGQIQITKEKN